MYHICFVCIYPLNGYRELNSFEEPCFMVVATITFLAREFNPTGVGEHIYCHPQTECFLVSQLFSMARQDRFPKLGSKPGWLKRQTKILPLSKRRKFKRLWIPFVLFTYIRLTTRERERNADTHIYLYVKSVFTCMCLCFSMHTCMHVYVYICLCVFIFYVCMCVNVYM